MAGHIDSDFRIPHSEGQRTLAAIVFTDAVNFSSRMNEDEEKALGLLREDTNRMHAICVSHGGSVLKFTGDGLLMYFQSAVQAVTCSLKIQNTQAEIAKITPEENCMQHRIGIHLGDVIVSEGDVLGDGVNIAARLQHEAKSGGICISQTVYDVVKNKIALKAKYLGPRELKNISESVPVYELLIGFEDEEEDMGLNVKERSEVPTAKANAKQEEVVHKSPGVMATLLPALAGALVVGVLVLVGVLVMLMMSREKAPEGQATNTTAQSSNVNDYTTGKSAAANDRYEPANSYNSGNFSSSNQQDYTQETSSQPAPLSLSAPPLDLTTQESNQDAFFNEALPNSGSTGAPEITVSPEELESLLSELSAAPLGQPEVPVSAQPVKVTPAQSISLDDLGEIPLAVPATPTYLSQAEAARPTQGALQPPAAIPNPAPTAAPEPQVLPPPEGAVIINSLSEGRSLKDDTKGRINKNMENTLNQSRNLRLLAAWVKSSLVSYNSDAPIRLYWMTTEGYVPAEVWAKSDNTLVVRWSQGTEEFLLPELPAENLGEVIHSLINDRARQGITPSQRVLLGANEFTSTFRLPELRKRIADVVSNYPALKRHEVF